MENEQKASSIYHERQRLQFCLLHALNNLFQEKIFTRSCLNSIADSLGANDIEETSSILSPISFFIKPHHNLWTGNYDVNVLMAALEGKGVKVVWHDRRSGAASIDLNSDDGTLYGMILNIRVVKYAGLWKGRHWVALRKIGGAWFNLDSELQRPLCFKDCDEAREFIELTMSQGAELLLIMNHRI